MANEFIRVVHEPGGLDSGLMEHCPGEDVNFLRALAQAYKRLSEGLAMKSPAIIGEAHQKLERLQHENVGVWDGGESVERQELVWVRNELEKLKTSIDKVLKG